MKINLFSPILFCFLMLFLSGSVGAQISFSEPLDHYVSAKTIKKNKVQSLIIFTEMNRDEISLNGSISGKTVEINYNEEGLTEYRLRSDNRGSAPFIAYGKGSFVEVKRYDSKGNLLHLYMENYQQIREEFTSYDSENNVTRQTYTVDNDTLVTLGFKWSKGRMSGFELIYANESNKKWVRKFDEKGRLTQTISNNSRVDYAYETFKDSLVTTQTVYESKSGTIKFIEKYTSLLKFNRITSYQRWDAKNSLIVVLRVSYDKYGNAVSYYKDEPNSNRSATVDMKIENVYDKRKLLIKRIYSSVKKAGELAEITKIDRYVFDSEQLLYTFAKGDIKVETHSIHDGHDHSGHGH